MRKIVHSLAAARAPAATTATNAEWSLYSPSGQRKYLNSDERGRFLAAAMQAQPKVRTLCLTLAYSGCRISEALNLTADDIDIGGGLIAIRTLKQRGKVVVRQVPAPPALLADIARVHRLDQPASHNASDAVPPLWPWKRTRAWQLVKEVMAAARISRQPASPKGLRHGFGVHAVLSRVPLTLIQKWLGHADIATTAIYLNVLGPEERAIAAWMW